jgi:fibronectin-binding autotransporter adhesin
VPNWTPIGPLRALFEGIYDGNGHTISNLSITVSTENHKGLFIGIGDLGVVKNLGIENCTIINTYEWTGGIAGENRGTVQNCYVTGNISGSMGVGGIVGTNGGIVQNCYTACNVSSIDDGEVGGVVGLNSGYNNSTVRNCVALNTDVYVPSLVGLGRVAGWSTSLAILADNYGRSDMTSNGSLGTWGNDPAGVDGADISSIQYNTLAWWTTKSNWNTTPPAFAWDFTTVWEWGPNNLPILRNMPGTAVQNPIVK